MANNEAILNWNDNTEPDLASYTVLLGLYPGQYFITSNGGSAISGVTLPSTFFTTSDGLWYFAVSAVDTSGNISGLSNVVSKQITRVQSKLRHRR